MKKLGIIKEEVEYVKYSPENGSEKVISKREYFKEKRKFEKEYKGCDMVCQPFGINTYKVIRLSEEEVLGLVGVLSYDRALNLFALKYGRHPASGFESCSAHECNVRCRERQIALLGEKPHDVPESIFRL